MTFSPGSTHPGQAELPGQFLVRAGLENEDRAALLGAVSNIETKSRGSCVRPQGEQPQSLLILVEGVALAARLLPDDSRQVLALYVPGDVMDGQPVPTRTTFELCAITDVSIARIPHQVLAKLLSARPNIAFALWCESARNMAIQQEWLVSLGRDSRARLAHFLCEISERFSEAGLGEADHVAFPLTQTHVAEALGLSVVHLNRVLQQMRREGLVAISQGHLHIVDRSALQKVADFDPAYLGKAPNR